VLGSTYETIGLLVFRRLAPLDLVRQQVGGVTRVLWRKLAPWMQEHRIASGNPHFVEWWQWLVEHDRDAAQAPAWSRYRDWRE